MYEIIDETLKLASCSINDLTLEQASSFLSQWEDGAKLGTLTMFFNPDTGYLVLNKDHAQYEFYLKLAKAYLSASEKELEKYRERFGGKFGETLSAMNNFREYKRVQSDLDILDRQSFIVADNRIARSVLRSLEKKRFPIYLLLSQAYSYGMMNGKRIERARRKAGVMA